jgi:triacylglycerol lipase
MVVKFDIQDQPGFSLTNAWACAEASRLAYEPVRNADCGVRSVASPLNHARVETVDGTTVVAFRGTANFRDWLTDAECVRESHVHSGFKRAFDSIAIDLLDALKDVPEEGRIFFTGHSLGGAQAVLASWAFASHYPRLEVYTFGQPRVGDAYFASQCKEKFGARHFRFVNQEDIVPRVPGYLMGYRHSGQEIFFPSLGGGMRLGAPLWMKLGSDLYGTWLDYRKGEIAQLSDHAMSNYCLRIQEQFNRNN